MLQETGNTVPGINKAGSQIPTLAGLEQPTARKEKPKKAAKQKAEPKLKEAVGETS